MKRKFREALGVDQDEQIDDFLKDQLVIENTEGIDLSQIGKRNIKITMDQGSTSTDQYGDVHNIKL